MGWKLSDLVFFPLKTKEVVTEPSDEVSDSLESPQCEFLPRKSDPEGTAISLCWKFLAKHSGRSSSGPLPGNSDPRLRTLESFLAKGAYRLKIKAGIKKKDLFRFLLAKMLYEREEGLHIDEFLVLWELYLQLQGLLSKDPSFKEKYERFFRDSFLFFQELGNQKEFPIRVEDDENLQYLERIRDVLEPMLPTRAAYFGLKGQKNLRSGFSLVFEDEILQRKIPEGRRIGVGYRDKGSRRDPAFDGSPDWRDVAMSFLEQRIQRVELLCGCVRESPDFDWDFVLNSQPLPDESNEEDDPPFPEP